MTDAKAELRRHALARRDLVTPTESHEAASEIAHAGLAFVERAAREGKAATPVVAVYWPIRSELNTRPLIDALASAGLRVTLPVMHRVRYPLVFRDFTPGDALLKGPYGLSEPAEDRQARDPDIIFAPLAAFDRQCRRIGYGGGIYDATLLQLRAKKPVIAIGLAYSFQEVANTPTEPHDQLLDFILTERELIAASAERAA
jgi:5-formyltetrahydrofolate cyclo-ligase